MNGGAITEVETEAARERPIEAVRGTRDWAPAEFAGVDGLEALLLDRFARAGYQPLRTPVLEPTDLHERKSGAGIVSKLFELKGGAGPGGVCLRPELTAGIVRAYTHAEPAPGLPWRVSHAGAVFRYEANPRADRLREFQQVGVERLGDGGAIADAEVIWLADWALAEAGVKQTSIRVGHVGLILEMLRRSGLPAPLGAALIERLSEAAAEGEGVHALETALEQLRGWLGSGDRPEIDLNPTPDHPGDPGIDRLFRTLVPVVTGRRTGREIVHRLRRKWDLGHGLLGALERVRKRVHELAGLKGPFAEVLDRLGPEGDALAPASVAALRALIRALEGFGVDPARLTLDLGFGRGIGFYSQVIFEITAATPDGRSVEVGGGGRYDGLARVLGSDRDDRGVGFAFGLERVASVLAAQGKTSGTADLPGLVVVAGDPSREQDAAQVATAFRCTVGINTLLETGPNVDEIVARGLATGAHVMVVSGPINDRDGLTLHDPEGAPPFVYDRDFLFENLPRSGSAAKNAR